MPAFRLNQVARRLGEVTAPDATDRELLQAFLDQRDQAAFATLLRRHDLTFLFHFALEQGIAGGYKSGTFLSPRPRK